MLKEFKEFISKGNVLDLAVGVVMGSAFSGIVTSLVNDIIMPFVGLLIGGIDFSGMKATVGDASIAYGNFIQNIVNFLIIAISIFMFIKFINRLTKKVKKEEEKEAEEKVDPQTKLLEEIRDEIPQDNLSSDINDSNFETNS